MKQRCMQLVLLIVIALPFAFSVRAYSVPKAAPTASNTSGPLTEGISPDVKFGGLSVKQFNVLSGSEFSQDASFRGIITGIPSDAGSQASPKSEVFVQNSILTTGPVSSKKIIVDNLSTGSTVAYKKMCADKNGAFVVCATAPVVPDPGTDVVPIGGNEDGSATLQKVTFDLVNKNTCSATFSMDAGYRTRSLKLSPTTTILRAEIYANVLSETYDQQCVEQYGETKNCLIRGSEAMYCAPYVQVKDITSSSSSVTVFGTPEPTNTPVNYAIVAGKEIINAFCVRDMRTILAPSVPSQYQYFMGSTITALGGTGGRLCSN